MSDWRPWAAVVLAAVVTYFWRGLGVALSGRINPNGALFEWIGCVAYALLAGLVSRMIVLPIGPLQATDLASRLIAVVVTLAAFFAAGRSIVLGVAAGMATLIGLTVAGAQFW